MVDKFVNWFFSEIDMYGPDIKAGIIGDYVPNKILGLKSENIYLFVSSNNEQWINIKDNFINHLQNVWNIFQNYKIVILKKESYYYFNIYNVEFRIYWEKPYSRYIFAHQTLEYIWKNKKIVLEQNFNSIDHLYLIKTLNNIKKRKLMPLHPKKFILDHEFFIADRDHYVKIIDHSFYLICNGWSFDINNIRLHTTCENICSICRNEDESLKLKIKCGHIFHKNCLKELMLLEQEHKHSQLCPNCRSPIQVFYN